MGFCGTRRTCARHRQSRPQVGASAGWGSRLLDDLRMSKHVTFSQCSVLTRCSVLIAHQELKCRHSALIAKATGQTTLAKGPTLSPVSCRQQQTSAAVSKIQRAERPMQHAGKHWMASSTRIVHTEVWLGNPARVPCAPCCAAHGRHCTWGRWRSASSGTAQPAGEQVQGMLVVYQLSTVWLQHLPSSSKYGWCHVLDQMLIPGTNKALLQTVCVSKPCVDAHC